jgi:hypothetical protein
MNEMKSFGSFQLKDSTENWTLPPFQLKKKEKEREIHTSIDVIGKRREE